MLYCIPWITHGAVSITANVLEWRPQGGRRGDGSSLTECYTEQTADSFFYTFKNIF